MLRKPGNRSAWCEALTWLSHGMQTDMGSDKAPRPAEDGARAISWAYLSPKVRSDPRRELT